MPGGGKGPTSSGNITQTTVNPTQQAQLPFLEGKPDAGLNGWSGATTLTANDPLQYYPGQTLADFNPAVSTGYNYLVNNGLANEQSLRPAGNQAYLNATTGGYGVQNSPAYSGLTRGQGYGLDLASGSTGPQTSLEKIAGGVLGPNAGTDQLAKTASGAYLGSNPYLAAEFKAASQPVVNAYQTATAPQTDSNFEAAGRYGSGAHANAQSINEQNLGTTLGNLSANLYGQDYANERGLQTGAASSLGGLLNNAGSVAGNLTGADLAGRISGVGAATGAGNALQQGYQAGNSQALQGLALEPGVLGAGATDANQILQGGLGLTGMSQQQIQDAMQRFYGTQQAPWQQLAQEMNLIGQPTGGSNSVTSPLLGPNAMSSALGTGLGGLSLYNGLNTATGGAVGSGLGSLFGSAPTLTPAAAGTPFIVPGTGAAIEGATGVGGATSLGGKGASSFLPFLAA